MIDLLPKGEISHLISYVSIYQSHLKYHIVRMLVLKEIFFFNL